MHPRSPLLFITLLSLLLPNKISSSFVVSNNCPFTIWPGTLAGSGTPALPTTGFRLDTGKSVKIVNTPGWSGRIWARTGCQFDSTGSGTCLTGDCGGKLECSGNGAAPPTSLFEITLGKGHDKDFYDVSLVDGYNLPIVAWPLGVNVGACNATGCVSDLNMGCPKELQVVGNTAGNMEEGGGGGGGGGGGNGVVACKSACEAFGLDQYCCSGQFANPNTCKPSVYSSLFKRACPSAYSYAFDDGTSTFTCKSYDYAIVFCPTTNKAKNSEEYMSPPPPSAVYTSTPPPSAVYTSPPPPPAAVYTSPTPPSAGGYTFPSTPSYQKHTNEASMGEASSSSILQPVSLLILWLWICSLFC